MATDSDDSAVLAKAQGLEALLISLNGDFADIVMYPPANFLGIIALQVKDHPEVIPALLRRLLNYVAAHPSMEHSAAPTDVRGAVRESSPYRDRHIRAEAAARML